MSTPKKNFNPALNAAVRAFIILLLLSGCNLPQAAPPTEIPANPTAVPATLPPPPQATDTPVIPQPVAHLSTPDESITIIGDKFYDVDSSGTGQKHFAPFGDAYDLNRFERPFTQQEMTYIPSLDILTFQLTQSADWNYAFIKMAGPIPGDASAPNYGLEIDLDRDGFGEILIWARPPYGSQWTTDNVQVYRDNNHSTGGINPSKSDAPYPGDGYETLIFDLGKSDDPDLVWARIAPDQPNVIEFAFKRSLTGDSFMWSPWADSGLKDPAQFNYNDRFTILEAGSPVKDDPYYPVKSLFAVDNSCRANFGFAPTGYEPLLCFYEQPTPTRGPGNPPTLQPGITPIIPLIPLIPICLPPKGGCTYGWDYKLCMCIIG